MRLKSTFLYLLFISIGLFLLNNADGPANVQGLDRTGSPISPGSCSTSGCHDAGAFDPSLSIEVLSSGDPISGYEPGASYEVRVTINAASGTPTSYGFQTTALNGNNENAGLMGFPSGGQQLVTFASGIEYMEHATPSSSNVFSFTWDAPAAGEGDVNFYSGGVAVNDNSNPGGDGGAVNSLTLTEGFLLNSNDVKKTIGFSVIPNPALEFVNINIRSNGGGLAQLQLIDMTGKVVHAKEFGIHQGENVQLLDVETLNSGLYLINLIHDGQLVSKKFLKL